MSLDAEKGEDEEKRLMLDSVGSENQTNI